MGISEMDAARLFFFACFTQLALMVIMFVTGYRFHRQIQGTEEAIRRIEEGKVATPESNPSEQP